MGFRLTNFKKGIDKMAILCYIIFEVILMYTKDKSIRITLRLNENQFDYVKYHSDNLGVSPSEFLRMVINSTMAITKGSEMVRRENEQSNIDNIV